MLQNYNKILIKQEYMYNYYKKILSIYLKSFPLYINQILIELDVINLILFNLIYFKNMCITFKYSSFTRFDSLMDIFVLDFLKKQEVFKLKYIFRSFVFNHEFIFNVYVHHFFPFVDTITYYNIPNTSNKVQLYGSAIWAEREIYDMFGIFFEKHEDQRRILTDYGFIGYALRKSFPLMGFKEVRFDDFSKNLIYELNELTQIKNHREYI